MYLRKDQWKILYFAIIAVIFYSIIFISQKNYEFMIYIVEILFFLFLIIITNEKMDYPNYVLWGLTIWAIFHMSGGALYFGGKRLYDLILLPIAGAPYHIFRYDQFTHLFGFAVATLVMYHLLKPNFKKNFNAWISISIVVIMAGTGAGALNEVIEFLTTVVAPSTGVGGYINNSLDLVFNLLGAICAMVFLIYKEKEKVSNVSKK